MKEKLKTLQLIHLSLCAGLMLVYFLLGDLNSLDRLALRIDSSNVFNLIVPVVAFGLSNFLFKSQLKKIDPNLSLEEKMLPYQTASLIRWAVLEAAAFYIVVLSEGFIAIGIAVILYMIILRPSENRVKTDLGH